MPVIFEKKESEFQIAIWETTESLEDLSKRVKLSEIDTKKIQAISNEKRKLELITTRVLLNEILLETVQIQYTKDGKPYLSNGTSISISHSGNFVAICLSKEDNPGIDIEVISKRVGRVKNRFLSSQELDFIGETPETELLTLLWSVKEAVFKSIPYTNIDFRDQIIVKPFKFSDNGNIDVEFLINNEIISLKLKYQIFSKFVLAYTIVP